MGILDSGRKISAVVVTAAATSGLSSSAAQEANRESQQSEALSALVSPGPLQAESQLALKRSTDPALVEQGRQEIQQFIQNNTRELRELFATIPPADLAPHFPERDKIEAITALVKEKNSELDESSPEFLVKVVDELLSEQNLAADESSFGGVALASRVVSWAIVYSEAQGNKTDALQELLHKITDQFAAHIPEGELALCADVELRGEIASRWAQTYSGYYFEEGVEGSSIVRYPTLARDFFIETQENGDLEQGRVFLLAGLAGDLGSERAKSLWAVVTLKRDGVPMDDHKYESVEFNTFATLLSDLTRKASDPEFLPDAQALAQRLAPSL